MGKKAVLLILAVIIVLTACDAVSATDSKTTQISVGTGGQQACGDSTNPAITPDGRYVAFDSKAKNLVPGGTNGKKNVFVTDGWTRKTIRVSKGLGGTQANGDSANPSITPDGRYVAFESTATNMVQGGSNGAWNIFVYDGWTRKTIQASIGLGGVQPHCNSHNPSITPDGRYVTFESTATNLVRGGSNGLSNIFVFDGWTGIIRQVTKTLGGYQANGNSYRPVITPNGRYVAFDSYATNLVRGGTNGKLNVFVFDGWTNVMNRVSKGLGGAQVNGNSYGADITPDGRYVAFNSWANNLVASDANTHQDVFVYDG